ncbi:hypothetical protein [Streptomyces erythrochromogenes]|uniref:hypothetical protein n=1 Tax=Streptomyces erythrochromogenes TaxID=285574 RepID=UPI0036AB5B09
MTNASNLPQPLGFPQCPKCPYVRIGSPEVCALCASKSIKPLAALHCELCSQTLSAPGAACWNAICNWTPERRFFTRVDAVALFAYPLEQTIKSFKYQEAQGGWATIFGRLIVGWMNAHLEEMRDIDIVLGNPSAPDRTPIQHVEEIMKAAYAEDTLGRWPIPPNRLSPRAARLRSRLAATGRPRWKPPETTPRPSNCTSRSTASASSWSTTSSPPEPPSTPSVSG